jgi:hypothetical protein
MLKFTENGGELPKTVITFEDRSPESTNIKREERQRLPLPEKKLITQEEIDYFTNLDLMKLIMENSYNCEEYGLAVAHICFEDEKLSKKVARFLLKGISSANDNLPIMENYLKVVEAMCSNSFESPDSEHKYLPRKRLEWIFGFGILNEVETSERHVFGLEGTFHNLKTEVYRLQSMVNYDQNSQRSLLL